MFEFGDEAIFHNLVLNYPNFDQNPAIMRIIKKGNLSVLVFNQTQDDEFKLVDSIISKFSFQKEDNQISDSNLNNQMFYNKMAGLVANDKNYSIQTFNPKNGHEENNRVYISSGEIGNVIIQRHKTITPLKDEQLSVDYILFWLANEDMKTIEEWYNDDLLFEINSIQYE